YACPSCRRPRVRRETQQSGPHGSHFVDAATTRFGSTPPPNALRSTEDCAKCPSGCLRGGRFRRNNYDTTRRTANRCALSRSCFRSKRRTSETVERCADRRRLGRRLKAKLIFRHVRVDFVRPFGDPAFEIKRLCKTGVAQ